MDTTWTDEDIADFIADTLNDHHDMDVGFGMHAKNLVKKMRAEGLLAVAPLDLDGIRSELARLKERACKLDRAEFITLVIWPACMPEHKPAHVVAHMRNLRAEAGTPAEAIAAMDALLDRHDPAKLEAEGWATLGATVAA